MEQGQFRTMHIGSILVGSIRLYARNFLRFLGITAIVYAPLAAVLALAQARMGAQFVGMFEDRASPPPGHVLYAWSAAFYVIVLAGFILAIILVNAALMKSVSRSTFGRSRGFERTQGLTVQKLGTLLLAAALATLIITAGTAVFVVPGIVFGLWFAFVGQVVVAEGAGPLQALKRSKGLAAGNVREILGLGVVVVLLFYVLTRALPYVILAVPYFHVGWDPGADGMTAALLPQILAYYCGYLVLLPFVGGCYVLLYHELRARQDVGLQAGTGAGAVSEGRMSGEPSVGGAPGAGIRAPKVWLVRAVYVAAIVALGIAVFWYVSERRSGDGPPEPGPLENALLSAAQEGDLEGAKGALAEGANVNAKGLMDMTPLHLLVVSGFAGDMDMVELLISKGADVNARDELGQAPLHYVAGDDRGDIALARFLIANGADVNAQAAVFGAPLHAAIVCNHKEMVELLLASGADLQVRNDEGQTPLGTAIQFRRSDIVERLLAAGSAVDIFAASARGMTDRVRALLEADPTLARAKETGAFYETTALHKAAYYGHKDVVELLLRYGAVVNAEDSDKATPLHQAVYAGHGNIVEVLLAHGANVNAPAWGEVGDFHEFDDTPLHLAARRGHTDVAALLLEHGADVTAKNREGYKGLAMPTPGCGLTPLGVALKASHTDVADLLRQHGARE